LGLGELGEFGGGGFAFSGEGGGGGAIGLGGASSSGAESLEDFVAVFDFSELAGDVLAEMQ
jgi:hypothetical protein